MSLCMDTVLLVLCIFEYFLSQYAFLSTPFMVAVSMQHILESFKDCLSIVDL